MIGSCAVLGFIMLPVIWSAAVAFMLAGAIPGTPWSVPPNVSIAVSILCLIGLGAWPHRTQINEYLKRESFRSRLPSKRFSN